MLRLKVSWLMASASVLGIFQFDNCKLHVGFTQEHKLKRTSIALAALISSFNALAFDYANVPDAGLLKWQMDTAGVVYFRNLNEFDPTFLPCCYNYSLDTTTPVGKSMWATILLRIATSRPVSLGMNDKSVPSSILQVGNH